MRELLLPTALALLLLAACGEPKPPLVPAVDLVERLPRAELSATDGGHTPVVAGDGEALFLPAGSSLSWPLLLPAGSAWRSGEIDFSGDGMALELAVESDDRPGVPAASWGQPRPESRLDLGLAGQTAVRLVLTAAGGRPGTGDGALVEAPEILAPRPPAAGSREPREAERSAAPPSVLLYLVDTLRSDRLGCYGYERPVSPRIDRFAAGATLYTRSIAQSSWTKASVGSIFTGLWPPEHGATGWKHALAAELDTLAERLAAAGYRTAAFVTNPNVVRAYGFDQGFDDFHRVLKRPSDEINEMVFAWLDEHAGEGPFFLYVHTMDPHAPYTPPEPWRSRFAPTADEMPSWKPRWKWPIEVLPFLSDLYDAEIAFNDSSFGALLDRLAELSLLDPALVVLTSDHGEEFKEHGRWRHGGNLHAPTLRVPLVIKAPGQRAGRVVDVPVQHADLPRTILAASGAAGDGVPGRDLLAAGGPPATGEEGLVFSHLKLSGPLQRSVVAGRWKLIQRHGEDGWVTRLYDLDADPGELDDESSEHPVTAAVLAALLEAKWAASEGRAAAPEAEADEEILDALEALGYMAE